MELLSGEKMEKGQEKINQICALLREDAIEPAKKEAERMIQEAQKKAELIINDAQAQAKSLIEKARKTIEQENQLFQLSLLQASKQGLEALRQEIEQKLFNDQLAGLLEQPTTNPNTIAELINALIKTIEKEGLATEITAVIPRSVSARDINKLILEKFLSQLDGQSVKVGSFKGGVQLRLNHKKLTIDMTKESLQELLVNYIRKDFRKMIFGI